MQPTITVDARQALAKFSKAGIPEAVRSNLRRALPDLMKNVGGEIERMMDSQLKTRRSIVVVKQMIENPWKITGRVTITSSKRLLPLWLEEGTRPHEIVPRVARVLAFYSQSAGRMIFTKRVMHPGTRPYRFAQTVMESMEPEIVDVIDRAAKIGARQA